MPVRIASPSTDASRRPFAVLCGACVVFIVYGSLFPFAFTSTAQPIGGIFAEWNPWLNRSDAIDNVLLFVPLGIALGLAVATRWRRWSYAAVAWLALGVGLQVAQLFVPSRVASMADAVNNAIGLTLGLLLARPIAGALSRRAPIGGLGDRFAWLLVIAWYAYESFPFIPTLDVGLLAAHVKPLMRPVDFEALRLIRHALAAAIGTIALLSCRPWPRWRLCLGVVAAVLFVSEMTVAFGDLRLESLLGIGVGMVTGAAAQRLLGARARWAVLVLAIASLLMTVLTPFRGPASTATFTWTPFSNLLWQGTTGGIPTVAFEALAIGALVWAVSAAIRPGWQTALAVMAAMVGLELLRRTTGNGPGDTGNLVVAALLLSFAKSWRADEPAATPAAPVGTSAAHAARVPLPHRTAQRRVIVQAVIVVAGITAALWFGLRLPAMPYNVRELFDTLSLPTLCLFSLALLWIGAGPGWMVRSAARWPMSALWLPALVVAVSMFSLLLLRLTVTQESLDDITGSTDLYRRILQDGLWGDAWQRRIGSLPEPLVGAVERGVRYTALYATLLIPLATVWLCIDPAWRFAQKLLGVPLMLGCWWLAKFIVIDVPITDNLVELIADDGVPWLALLLIVLAIQVAVAAGPVGIGRTVASIAIGAAALPLGWRLLKRGLEPVVMKYGLVFSAPQFLLGRDRTTLLTEGQLFGRWCVLYLAMTAVILLGLSFVRRWDASVAKAAA